MKKFAKVIALIMMMVFLSSMLFSLVGFAAGNSFDPGAVKNSITTAAQTKANGEDAILNVSGIVLWTLKYVGFILGILLLVWFGIKWMTVGPNERAQLKDQAWNYVIGAVLLFGASPIAQWIYDMVSNFK